jgi:glutamyl/glutaminyl-tRNA synthetase
MPMATASVDRLNDVPRRLAFLFNFSVERALQDERVRDEFATQGARAVVKALAEELAAAPRLDQALFRKVANAVKAKTGQKSRALFHPIRIALTGQTDGPELDLAVPAIDRGAELPESAGMPKVMGNRERAAAFVSCLG